MGSIHRHRPAVWTLAGQAAADLNYLATVQLAVGAQHIAEIQFVLFHGAHLTKRGQGVAFRIGQGRL